MIQEGIIIHLVLHFTNMYCHFLQFLLSFYLSKFFSERSKLIPLSLRATVH